MNRRVLRTEERWKLYRDSAALIDQVQEGGRVKLSADHIKVSDLDTPRKDLLLWLVSPPKFGRIENARRGEATVTFSITRT